LGELIPFLITCGNYIRYSSDLSFRLSLQIEEIKGMDISELLAATSINISHKKKTKLSEYRCSRA